MSSLQHLGGGVLTDAIVIMDTIAGVIARRGRVHGIHLPPPMVHILRIEVEARGKQGALPQALMSRKGVG
jgi:hypothetical protein